MVAPINYDTGAPDTSSIIANGYQMGLVSGQRQQDAALKEAQANKINQEAMRRQKMQEDLAALQNNANPTAADYSRIASSYPELADPMKKSWEIMDSGQQRANLSLMSQALSAVKSGRPEIATKLLTDQSTALRNSGKENEAKAYDTWAKLIEIHPEMAVNTANIALASVMDPKEFTNLYDKLNPNQQMNDYQKESLALDKQRLAIQEGRAAQDNSYFTFGQTAGGIVRQNARTGEIERVTDANGDPIIGASADPTLRGKITESEKTGALNAERVSETKKALKMNDQILAYSKTARELIPKATGSGLGAVADAAGRMVGISSDSAKAAARLKTLSGWLVSNVPRMEGPQSNSDVENYRTMAAKVGDDTATNAERLEALDELVSLIKKQKELNNQVLSGKATPENKLDDTTQLLKDADAILGLP